MIRLELKGKQCEDCPCFSPISETNIMWADCFKTSSDTIIKCKNDNLCSSLMDYLERHMERREK